MKPKDNPVLDTPLPYSIMYSIKLYTVISLFKLLLTKKILQ